jgi:EmrB/QacA subfamily drug resistance transporter
MAVENETEAFRTSPGPSKDEGPPRHLGLALVVIATTQLMLILDSTIVSVALPKMQSSLHLLTADLNWVLTAYSLTFGGLLLVGGRAGDLFGRKRLFRAGLVVFTAASLVGGLAENSGVLITGRVLQGVGAAIAAPNALSLLATTFPAGPARNKAMGVYGAMGGLGSVVGLLLGGALTEYLSWRWVMFVNVPIAVLVLLGTGVLREGSREHGRLDLPGAITATLSAAGAVYGINRGNSSGWSDTGTITCLVLAVVLLGVFVMVQRASSAPMLPPTLLRDRARAGAVLVMLTLGAGMAGTFFFLTLYMQFVKGYSPMTTGVYYLPFAFAIGLGAGAIGPQLLARISERAVVLIGMLVGSVGTAWFGLLTSHGNPFVALLPAQLVAGVGIGLAFVTVTVVSVRGVDPQNTGIASGLVNTAQQVGGAIGLAALAAAALAATRSYQHRHSPLDSLTHGYDIGFLVAAGIYLVGLVIAAVTLGASARQQASAPQRAADAAVEH